MGLCGLWECRLWFEKGQRDYFVYLADGGKGVAEHLDHDFLFGFAGIGLLFPFHPINGSLKYYIPI